MTARAMQDAVRGLEPPGSTCTCTLAPDAAHRAGTRQIRLPDAARGMGVFCAATRGTGKSRVLGRVIAWHDFQRGIPLVVLDPVGGTIDNLLDKIGREPLGVRRELWKRIRYVNMNGQDDRVVPWPIYYEAEKGEEFSAQSQRFLDLIARLDPALYKAPILGFNTLAPIALASGIVLCALGLGVTELPDLIADPRTWEGRLAAVLRTHPETAPAVQELRKLGQLPPKDRENRIGALTNKLSLVRFHPNFRAIFGASTPAINWQEVLDRKLAVLIDFRNVLSPEHQKFCVLWVYNSFLTFIKTRGHGEMDNPVSFIIDELTFLVGTAAQNDELLTADLNELVNRIARSHGVWLTLATQELFQLSEQIRQTVLSMGTVIFGQMSDRLAAQQLAERYYRYDPYKVKKSRTIYSSATNWVGRVAERIPVVVGEQTTEFTRAEQIDENSRVFLDLAPYHFLIGQSRREGELPTALRRFTIEQVDAGEYPDKKTIESLRSQLMRRDGIKADKIRAEIANRLSQSDRLIGPSPLSGGTDPVQPDSVPAADTPSAGTHSQQPTPPADAPPPAALQPPVRQAAADRPPGLPPLQPNDDADR